MTQEHPTRDSDFLNHRTYLPEWIWGKYARVSSEGYS